MGLLDIVPWWTALVVVAAALFYIYLTWTFSFWEKLQVPFVRPVPIFGNMKDSLLVKKTIGLVYQDLYWKLDGQPFGGFFKFRQPAILLRDPELIKTVIVKEFSSFHDNDFSMEVSVDPLFGRNPFVLRGDTWRIVRSQLTPGFTSGKLKTMFPLMVGVCEEMKTYIEKIAESADDVHVDEITTRLTSDAVATCAYGIRGEAFTDPDDEFRKMGIRFMSPTFLKGLEQMCIILAPWLATALRIQFVPRDVGNFFRNVLKTTMDHREKNGIKANDFLQLLMQLKQKAASNNATPELPWFQKFTDEDIAAQALTFFTDGYETTSLATLYTLYELALNPGHQDRTRDEVDAVLERHGGKLTWDGVQEMEYLDRVVSEALRIHPPVMFLNRLCTKPFELASPSGRPFTVPVGTPMVVPVFALHHDPQYYPRPETFDPDRFEEEAVQARPRYVYLPFGEGPRICLGMRFARDLTKASVATILAHFMVHLTPSTPRSLRYSAETFMLMPLEKVAVRFVKRSRDA